MFSIPPHPLTTLTYLYANLDKLQDLYKTYISKKWEYPVAPPVNVLHSPLQSAYTASITPLKQPYCISMIISSMPSDHRRCHAMSLPFSRFRPNNPPFTLIWNSVILFPWFKSHPFRLIHDFSSERMSSFWCQSLHLYSLFYNCTLNILNRVLLQSSVVSDTQPIPSYILMKRI